MKTCKDCKFYEKKTGFNIMWCNNDRNTVGFSTNINTCTEFKLKKSKKKKYTTKDMNAAFKAGLIVYKMRFSEFIKNYKKV